MGMPMLQEFLCGMKIRTGTLILGWLSLINSVLVLVPATVLWGAYLEMDDKSERQFLDWVANKTDEELNNHSVSPQTHQEEMELARLTFNFGLAFVLISGIVSLSASIMLICGVHKKNWCLMLPWLFLSAKSALLSIITVVLWLLIVPFVELGVTSFWTALYIKLAYTIILLVSACIPIYCFLVVYTMYRNIKYESRCTNDMFQKL